MFFELHFLTTRFFWVTFCNHQFLYNVDSYSKWVRQKCYQFFINKKLKKLFYFLTCILPNYVTHEITKEFWKNSLIEICWLISFWGVKIHFGEKYAWFSTEILIHGSKSCLFDMLWSQKVIKKSSRYNTNYI